MYTEILKIVPKIDEKDLRSMTNSLQTRFKKIAKGFGKGLVGALKGAGIAGIALALVDKLLNPLKEVQEAIDRSLKASDDIATNASQFNTTSGKLAKLMALGQASGLDSGSLFQMMTKFQVAVAKAQNDPNDTTVSSVKNYTDVADTSDAFFGFIQELKKLEPNQRTLVQEQIFGSKQILKMADFLQQDFVGLSKRIGLNKISSKSLTGSIGKQAGLNDYGAELGAINTLKDYGDKANVINKQMVENMNESAKIALEKENNRIKSYNDIASLSQVSENIMIKVDEGVALLGKFVAEITPTMKNGIRLFEEILKSPMLKGIGSIFGKGK